MRTDRTYIFDNVDSFTDELQVEAYDSMTDGPVVIFRSSDHGDPWLTPKDSKRLRKALKRWERSVSA